MEIKIERKVESMWIPPRCRKPRVRVDVKEFTVNLREVDEASFPVAYTVQYRLFHSIDDETGNDRTPPLHFRYDNVTQKLYVPTMYAVDRYWQRTPFWKGEEKIKHYLANYRIEQQGFEESILDSIHSAESSLLVFDNTLYFQTAYEPVYTLEFDRRHAFFSIDTWHKNGDADGYPENMYRADELPLIRARFNKGMEQLQKAGLEEKAQSDKKYFEDCLKKETILIGESFYTQLPDYDTRMAENLRAEVESEMNHVFETLYQPEESEPEHDGLQKLSDAMIRRISTSEIYKKNRVVSSECFFKAFWAEINDLYGSK